MLTAVNSSITKKLLIVLSIVLAVFMSLSGVNVSANANTDSVKKLAKTDKYQEKMAIVESALVIENDTYKIDESLAQGRLSQKEITEINTYFQNIDPELLNIAQENPEGISTYVVQLLPVVVAFLGTLAVFVGWELATAITADFYKWGVKSGCKKWKKVKVVKSFCTANDYL